MTPLQWAIVGLLSGLRDVRTTRCKGPKAFPKGGIVAERHSSANSQPAIRYLQHIIEHIMELEWNIIQLTIVHRTSPASMLKAFSRLQVNAAVKAMRTPLVTGKTCGLTPTGRELRHELVTG